MISQLSATLDTLENQWSGDAALAYRSAQLKWNVSMRRMTLLLKSASEVSGNVVKSHLETRASVVRLWR
ncbi:WXG100 family type VII secretion target [Leucobacter coleopterorum]|uniref:WXG100 family type VII secretion target n=1 Tax=Leucobacter coleopterorum TaxID=2714933 RepID=A0ABX6JZ47_9MICO|nr:WXG100 family type VII secretion target [Leucobacter coleopterorum]